MGSRNPKSQFHKPSRFQKPQISVPQTLLSYVAGTFCGTTSKIRHCVLLLCV
jgi:hypothetical protein